MCSNNSVCIYCGGTRVNVILGPLLFRDNSFVVE